MKEILNVDRETIFPCFYTTAQKTIMEAKRGWGQYNCEIWVHCNFHGFRHVPVRKWARGMGDRARAGNYNENKFNKIFIQKPYAGAYDFQKKTLYFLDVKNRIVDG